MRLHHQRAFLQAITLKKTVALDHGRGKDEFGNDRLEYQISWGGFHENEVKPARHPGDAHSNAELTMFTKTKTVLAAALVAATSTVALATSSTRNPAKSATPPRRRCIQDGSRRRSMPDFTATPGSWGRQGPTSMTGDRRPLRQPIS